MEWAKKEIELAIKRERGNASEDEWDYGVACYESAFKAFKSLIEDGHSGMSMSITKGILNKLIDGKPLTPITEDDFEGVESEHGLDSIQCPRMSALFKHTDGNVVSYTDVNRVVIIDIENGTAWGSGLFREWMDKKYPITLPYSGEKIKIYFKDFLINPANGDYDSYYVSHYVLPDGKRIDVDKFFTVYDNNIDDKWYEISLEELGKINFNIPEFIKNMLGGNK